MDFFATSDEILRLSLLTLVHRAAPQQAGAPATFSPACIEAARATLDRHQDCLEIIQRSSEDLLPTYVHWYVNTTAPSREDKILTWVGGNRTLLFAPFVPFIVVFCHTIEARDAADLARLASFAASMQPAAAASDAAAKLHRLSQVLHGAAARCAELYARCGDGGGGPGASGERDAYLRLLCAPSPAGAVGVEQHGLGPGGVGGAAAGEQHAGPAVMNPVVRVGHGVQLEEWFYSNQAVMESLQAFSHDFPGED